MGMRYLSIVLASLLLVGCAQSTDVETSESDIQSQQETSESTEVESTPETDQVEPEDSSEQTEEPEPIEEETESLGTEETDSENNESETTETESAESESSQSDSSETESTESDSTESEEVTEEEPVEEEAPEETEPAGFTMAMVSENDDASSCWSAINGNVYDLTEWINSHPGGSSNILSLCGTDGSSSFNARHGGQSNPESTLQSFLLGPLS